MIKRIAAAGTVLIGIAAAAAINLVSDHDVASADIVVVQGGVERFRVKFSQRMNQRPMLLPPRRRRWP